MIVIFYYFIENTNESNKEQTYDPTRSRILLR